MHHKATSFRPRIRWVAFASAALTAALVTQVYALGLGKLEVKSALDEPLRAEIKIQPGAPGELDSLALSLGSASDFARAKVTRSDRLDGLEFSVVRDAATPMVVVTTKQPYSEPYLHFLLLAQWSGGRMIREYTALLDPPLYVAKLPAGPRAQRPQAAAEEPAPSPEPVVVRPFAEQQPQPRADRLSDVRRFGEYGPTAQGDTLWNIALDLRDSGTDLDLFQIMAALFEENPDAFLGGNMHRLKVGQTLRLEDLDAVAQIPSDSARLLYDTHLAEWNRALGVMLPALPNSDAAAPAPTASVPELPVTPILVYKGLAERVEIIENRVDRNSERLSEVEATLALVQASLARDIARDTAEPATDSAASKVAVTPAPEQPTQGNAAPADVADTPKMSAESAPVVDLSHDVSPAAEAGPVETDVSSSLVSAISKLGPVGDNETAVAETNRSTPSVTVVRSPAVPAIGDGASVTQIVNAAMEGRSDTLERADTQASAPVADTADSTQPASKFGWSEFAESVSLGFNWFTAGLIGALLLLFGLLFFMRQRRAAMDFQQNVFLDQKVEPETENQDDSITVATDDVAMRTGTFASTLRDFEIPGMVSVQTDKVDALAEAEIYMAYGRNEQAEGVLKEALADHPDRRELKLKLLEIYHKKKDVTSFEALAEALYADAEQHDPALWHKVAAMGWELNPNNLLFAKEGEEDASESTPPADGLDPVPDEAAFTEAETTVEEQAGGSRPVPSFAESNTGITEDDEPEPLAQADLYLAYGHVDQAATILKEAVAADPDDRSLKLKLLEVHAQRQDTDAFDALAEDLVTAGDASDQDYIDSLRNTLGPVAATETTDAEQLVAVEPGVNADYDLGLGDMVDGAVDTEADLVTDTQLGDGVVDEAEFLNDKIDSLEQDLASRERENRQLQERLETLQGQTSALVADDGDDMGSIDFDDQIEISEPAVGLLRADQPKIVAGESQIETLQRHVAALEDALRARDTENQALRERVELLEQKVSEIMEQLREIGIDIDSAEDIRTQALRLREIGGAG